MCTPFKITIWCNFLIYFYPNKVCGCLELTPSRLLRINGMTTCEVIVTRSLQGWWFGDTMQGLMPQHHGLEPICEPMKVWCNPILGVWLWNHPCKHRHLVVKVFSIISRNRKSSNTLSKRLDVFKKLWLWSREYLTFHNILIVFHTLLHQNQMAYLKSQSCYRDLLK